VFALFVATAMSISAIPVIAKVLMDMNLMRRDIGPDDSRRRDERRHDRLDPALDRGRPGGGGAVTRGQRGPAVGCVVLFLVMSVTVGRWLVKRALDYVQDEMRQVDRLLTLVVVFTFAFGAITQALHLEASWAPS
jgi:Kef-type K+ transport system membrane component KefB